MTVGSKVNPNFPIPGIDQSSRGFRDNFATIKQEFENIQGKHIQLVGALLSDPIQIGNGQQDILIPVNVSLSNIQAAGANHSVQYNLNNTIAGSEIYYSNARVGVNTATPASALHVIGNAIITSASPLTSLDIGSNLSIHASSSTSLLRVNSTNVITISNSNVTVGIGTAPKARLDVYSNDRDVVVFRASKNNSDNGIRFTTQQPNSTIGLILEQRNVDSAGGLRMDQTGAVSIHVGESMDASLSNASRVINILPNNNVGIGSMVPKNQLDVQGNAFISGHLAIGATPTISGSRAGNAALTSLLTALENMGLIIDSTTP
jgi:hypothetical protein